MLRALLAAILAGLLGSAPAFAQDRFRAPRIAALDAVSLEAPAAKSAAARVDGAGRLRVADVRALPKVAQIPAWTPAAGGFVARFRAASDGAEGLRVRLDLGALPGLLEVRAQGSDPARTESMTIDPANGAEAWTPWTEGPSQLIELFSRAPVAPNAVGIGALLHFTDSPFAKVAAASCTLSTACSSNDATLDAAIADGKKSVMKIQFVSGGSGFICTATLIDTPRRPVPFVLTANHCIDDSTSATSVTSFWFYESTSCEDSTAAPGRVQVSGGMQLVFTNFNADATLMQMNQSPPAGARFSPVNPALMAVGSPVVSISHPHGDTARWATGTSGALLRDNDRPYDMYSVNFIRGIIEPGSSGSGIFTQANGRLQLRGILSQGALDLSCSQPNLFTLYGRMEVFYPQIAQYIGATSVAPDDAPNRPQDVTATVSPVPLDTRGELVLPSQRIDYPGDIDIYKFTLAGTAWVSAFTLGSQDTVGTLLDSTGSALEAVDDAQRGDTNTGITRRLGPGTYYFSVGHWTPSLTGAYEMHLRADHVDANYTALWWNEAESGWGINVNHQGNILFATLFTYNADGSPVWLVMSNGALQADGSYQGQLFRATGPAFNASPWRAIVPQQVGTMRLAFASADAGTLTYTFNGATVTKSITRQAFRTLPTCTWSAFDRSVADNFQDLWWNPAESGWGVNITHQDQTLFATLFTYAANGQPLWLVMPDGESTAAGAYSGTLYRTTGPAFNANPWTPIEPIVAGTMAFAFTDGNAGTMTYTLDGIAVTKQIQRQVFSIPKTQCES
jgi:lysyl endopeptidase